MPDQFFARLSREMDHMASSGLVKPERTIGSKQGASVSLVEASVDRRAINLCSNNYLGLADDPRVEAAAIDAINRWGVGTASVRFISGTMEIHRTLEAKIADYLGFEDAITFAAAFDANAAVFEPLFDETDAIISDQLNHASIIDGVRLSKARRFRFRNGDMADLETQLKAARAAGARDVIVVTDGVFSMDGIIAPLSEIVAIARRYEALVMVDDCHATGVLGPSGQGSASRSGVQVDIVSGTFGKALGGAMGGFLCGRREIIAILKQRARPYLFSNALAPAVCGAAAAAIDISRSDEGGAPPAAIRERQGAS